MLFSDPGFKGKLDFQTLNLSLYLPIQPSAHISILPLAHSSLYSYLSTIPPFRGWEPKRGGSSHQNNNKRLKKVNYKHSVAVLLQAYKDLPSAWLRSASPACSMPSQLAPQSPWLHHNMWHWLR